MRWKSLLKPFESGWREDLAGTLQEQVAQGHHTFEALCAAVDDDPPPHVAEALAWAVSEGLLTHAVRPDGDWFELTLHGAANLAFRQSIERATGPDGQVDLGDVASDVAVAQVAADSARQRQRAQEEAHLLVGTAEREATVSFLNEQYARGTFDLDELERRATLAMAARTRGDLAVATADLGWSPFPAGSDHAVLPRLEASFYSEGEPGLFSGPRDRRTAAVLADKAWAMVWIGFGVSVVFVGFLKALTP